MSENELIKIKKFGPFPIVIDSVEKHGTIQLYLKGPVDNYSSFKELIDLEGQIAEVQFFASSVESKKE